VAVHAGPIADLFLVPAETALGLTVFLVTPDDSGVTVRRQEIVDGDAEALLELDNVALGPERVLGQPGGGAAVVEWLVTRGTVGLCALQAGVCAESLQLTAKYATGRVQFDRPIATFQAVGQRLADCYIDVAAIRLTLWQAAWRLSKNLAAHNEIAVAKFWAADGGHRVAHAAVHIHGGLGIDVDYPLHRYFVASKRIEFSLGGATTQLRRIGIALAAEPA
jgi:acyl-CoA dehydrogenase